MDPGRWVSHRRWHTAPTLTAHSHTAAGRKGWSSFAGHFSSNFTRFLPCQAPESQPGARRLFWHSHRDAHRQNGCTEHSWLAVPVHTQRYTLLEQPRRLRGAETAPLPFPPPPAAGGVPEASAAFAGRDAAEENAVCLPGGSLAMPRCTHPMRAWPQPELSSGRSRAGSVAPSPGEAAEGQGAPRAPRAQAGHPGAPPASRAPHLAEQGRARKSTGARIPGGSNPPGLTPPGARTHRGSHPRARSPGSGGTRPRPPSPSSAPARTRGDLAGNRRPAPPARGRPGPPVPSPSVARERAERREPAAVPAGGCPARVSAFSLGGEDIFTVSAGPLPHRVPHPDTARRTRPTPACQRGRRGGGAAPGAGPCPGRAGTWRPHQAACPGPGGRCGSACCLLRPAGVICPGERPGTQRRGFESSACALLIKLVISA